MSEPDLDTINRLYLELSQFATATTGKELRLQAALQLIAKHGGFEIPTEAGPIVCNGAWCAEQARRALEEGKQHGS